MKTKKNDETTDKRRQTGNKEQPDAAMRRDLERDRREHVEQARQQADDDIASDPDMAMRSPNDDLDEGETARLGEGENGLV